ncbi:MAG: TlpA family protein disulfide reductase [Bacteroidales bacterium]|nr:TlpA family protein disulfide reductase [Bacteroidales bacterium]
MRWLILFLVFFLVPSGLSAEEVILSGEAPDYAGTDIVFLKYSDQISGSESVVSKVQVLADGTFSATFHLDRTEYVFSYLGVYKVYLYAEPGSSYHVLLPPREDKEPGDFLNPYFEPVLVHLATAEYQKDELNTLIRMFDDAFLPYYNKHIVAIAKQADFTDLNNNIEQMEKPFSKGGNDYFNNYRLYKYALLRHLAYQQRSRYISDEYFKGRDILVNNTSYMELFNQVYDKYFHYFSRTEQGSYLGKAIQSQSFDSLRMVLASDEVLGSGNLPDLVLLKSLHDEFYDDNYSRSSLLVILDDYIEHCPVEDLKTYALSIRNKVTRLLAGFSPPSFALYDRDSNLLTLEDLHGKYVYLNFCSCFSYSCMNEFKLLENLYEKHHELLEIVTVIIDNDPDVINSFLQRSNYKWKFLHYGNQSTIIREYDVRAFPSYYLIDSEGKLAISPAPSPGEDFEAHLFKLLRSRGEL